MILLYGLHYYAFVLQILEYCSLVWASTADCHLQLLECQVCLMARLVLVRFLHLRAVNIRYLGCAWSTRSIII